MPVTERNVTDALIYLADDPHPLAMARYRLTIAENKSRETFARLFLASGEKTNDAKKAGVESDPTYSEAKAAEAEAILEMERHRARVKAAKMLIEVFRTENANARAEERIR